MIHNVFCLGKRVKKQSQKWPTKLGDSEGIVRTIPLFRDKIASQQRAAQLQKEIELADAGVVDWYKEHRKRPLAEHLEDFEQSLLAKGVTDKHAKMVRPRLERVFDECKVVFWNDIQASVIQKTISDLRKYVKTVGIEEINGKEAPFTTVRQAFLAEVLGTAATLAARNGQFVHPKELLPADLKGLWSQL